MADYSSLIIPRSYNTYASNSDLQDLRTTHDNDVAEIETTITEQVETITEQVETNTSDIATHVQNTNNPHNVTCNQIGASPVGHEHREIALAHTTRPTSADDLFEQGKLTFDVATSSMTINKPPVGGDGFILTLGWDNQNNCCGQIALANNGKNRMAIRGHNNNSDEWVQWEEIAKINQVIPIGFVYEQYPDTKTPSQLFGFGNWQVMGTGGIITWERIS